jgi:hypothetical protein
MVIMKRILSILAILSLAQQVSATEHVTSFLTDGYMTPETGWTLTAGTKWSGSSVLGKRLYRSDATILKGRTYRYSITVANRSAGSLFIGVGAARQTSTGTTIAGPGGGVGLTAIPDNFTTADGLISFPSGPADNSPDPNGSFRFICGIAKIAPDDPVLYAGKPGASHLHIFFGNTGVNAYSTWESLRTSGGSSCDTGAAPLNRSSYWTPVMLNGTGGIQIPFLSNFYYKQIPATANVCGFPDATHAGICTMLPNGLRYIAGMDMANPMSTGHHSSNAFEADSMVFQCMDKVGGDVTVNPIASGSYRTLKAMVDAGCPATSVIHVLMESPTCWDGVNLDTPNHRDHVSYPDPANGTVTMNWTVNGVAQTPAQITKCDTAHPYIIPSFSFKLYYNTDSSFTAGKWHLSSDDSMAMAMDAGDTLHMDYLEAWSPPVKTAWTANCIDAHRSCAGGDLGNDTYIKLPSANSDATTSRYSATSMSRYGFSRFLSGNGTFTGEITAVQSGQFYIYSGDGFTGDVTAFSLTDVTTVNPITDTTITGSD